MWRFSEWLPILPGEEPVSLGEGDTPLLAVPRTGERLGLGDLGIKDE
jgi:threonine synthase